MFQLCMVPGSLQVIRCVEYIRSVKRDSIYVAVLASLVVAVVLIKLIAS